MRRFGAIAVLVVATLMVAVLPASAQFDIYDNWRLPDGTPDLLLRSDRWTGADFGGQEVTRVVRLDSVTGAPVLFLRQRQEGQGTDNQGFAFFASNSLRFRHPEQVTRIKAKFKVLSVETSGHCPANTQNTTEANPAVIFWPVFNDGASSGPGDQTGDVQVNLRAQRFATDGNLTVLNSHVNIHRCTNASCSQQSQLPGTNLGPLPIVSPFVLKVIHNPGGATGAKLLVKAGANPQQAFGYPPGTLAGLNPAANIGAQIQAGGLAVNCTAIQTFLDVKTNVLKVLTNPEAVVP